MKATLLFLILSFVYVQSAFSCPTIEGSFLDADSESIKTISQNGCVSSSWSEGGDTVTLITDGVERIIESEGKMKAYGKVFFTSSELVIDIRVDYGGANDFGLPERFLTSYRIDKFNNLVEKIIPYSKEGIPQATEYVTFRRVN